jgi:putative ABC transport system substrate-binding protein
MIAALALACAVLVFASPAKAQQAGKIPTIGLLGPPEEPRYFEIKNGLIQGLQGQGFAKGSYQILEEKVPRGDKNEGQAAVRRLLRKKVNLIFSIGSRFARLARGISQNFQMVYITPGDPVKHKLAKTLAHPGGNTTAMTFEHPELAGKRLELLKEIRPGLRKILILFDPRDGSPRRGAKAARKAAQKMNLILIEREIRNVEDISNGLMALDEVDAYLVIPGGLPTGHYEGIIQAAILKRVPTMFHARTGSTMESLASYGTSDKDIAKQMARQVAAILRGTKAGDLPVERPRNVELTINLKTANKIGITIPPEILLQATKVIR